MLPLVSDFAKNTFKINILKAFFILIIDNPIKLIRIIVKYFYSIFQYDQLLITTILRSDRLPLSINFYITINLVVSTFE